MFGYVYLTENLINHKKYIGKKVSNIFLGTKYLGSGTYLKRAVKKYGASNFNVTLLCSCESSEELDNAEVMYIREYDAVNSDEFYNLADGIKGNTSGSRKSESWKAHMSQIATGRTHTEQTKRVISQIVSNTIWVFNEDLDDQRKIAPQEFEEYSKQGYRRGRRPLSKEHREALSAAHLGKKTNFSKLGYEKLKGNHNTKGRVWITNGVQNKLVNPDDQNIYPGFHKGMTRSSTTIESVLD